MGKVTAYQVLAARILWKNEMTHGQIGEVLDLLPAEETALTEFSGNLSPKEAARRAAKVKPLMTREEIRKTMQGD